MIRKTQEIFQKKIKEIEESLPKLDKRFFNFKKYRF